MSSAVYLYIYIYELCSFSNLSFPSPKLQLIIQPFRRFTYVTSSSLNSHGEPLMQLVQWWLRGASDSPPTAGVPSSDLSHSMWVSCCTKRSMVFLGVSPVFRSHKFHSTIFRHSSHLFRFISFTPVMLRQSYSTVIFAIHEPSIQGLHCISSLDPAEDML